MGMMPKYSCFWSNEKLTLREVIMALNIFKLIATFKINVIKTFYLIIKKNMRN